MQNKNSHESSEKCCRSCINIKSSNIFNDGNIIVQRTTNRIHRCSTVTLDTSVKEMKNQETAMLVDDTQESKLRGDTDQKDLVTGSVVNGFHPQLCAWQRKQTTISTSTERMDIDREICDAVSSCRSKENENIRDLVNTETLKGPKKQRRFSNEISIGNIYKDMFEDSNIAQVIATPGKLQYKVCHIT